MKIGYIKKWLNMISHKGVLHAKKGIGPQWEKNRIKGFYIDYSAKLQNKNIDSDGLPYNILADQRRVKIPITIIQYGLGACEKWFETEQENEKLIVEKVASYLSEHQQEDGGWDSFVEIDPNDRRSSMVQAEAAAFFIRASIITNDDQYMRLAKKAIDQMLLPVENGGASVYSGDDLFFYEFVGKPLVLNGWIYSIFGLYDYYLATNDKSIYGVIDKTKKTLSASLKRFDCKYWSYYNLDKAIASPFYHELHIVQLDILYILFGDEDFKNYRNKWTSYNNSKIKHFLAVSVKVIQKLKSLKKNDMIE